MDELPRSGLLLGEHGASIRDLGIRTDLDGDGLAGAAEITPGWYLPGTSLVRASALATMADVVAGKLANASTRPRICVTLDLDLHLTAEPAGPGFEPGGDVVCRARVVRVGSRIVAMAYDLQTAAGAPFGFGSASFMASPDPAHHHPAGFELVSTERFRLAGPWAELVGVRRIAAGRAELPVRVENVNATGALQGGLLALAAEEAVLAARPDTSLSSLSIRYLRGFRQVAAIAEVVEEHDHVARIELSDEREHRIGTTVVAHLRAAGTGPPALPEPPVGGR